VQNYCCQIAASPNLLSLHSGAGEAQAVDSPLVAARSIDKKTLCQLPNGQNAQDVPDVQDIQHVQYHVLLQKYIPVLLQKYNPVLLQKYNPLVIVIEMHAAEVQFITPFTPRSNFRTTQFRVANVSHSDLIGNPKLRLPVNIPRPNYNSHRPTDQSEQNWPTIPTHAPPCSGLPAPTLGNHLPASMAKEGQCNAHFMLATSLILCTSRFGRTPPVDWGMITMLIFLLVVLPTDGIPIHHPPGG
jgi:hypothetical protein